MSQLSSNKKQIIKGFTLVELLIVVIILAILAAIVVPQFASTTDDAKVSSLDSNLTAIRSAIDLYYQQHNNVYPGAVAGVQGTCTANVSGVATVGAVSFDTQLRYYTSAAGAVCDIKGGVFIYGPYFKKALPANPLTQSAVLAISTTGSLDMTDDGAAAGWKFDTVSGVFIANDNTLDASGNKYSTH